MTISVKNSYGINTTISTIDDLVPYVTTIGTRSYGLVERLSVSTSVTQSSSKNVNEIMLHASTKCYILVEAENPEPSPSTGIPIEAGEKFHMRINFGDKIGVIRDSTDGFLHIVNVT